MSLWLRLPAERGAITIVTSAFVLMVMLGLGAVTVDVGSWFTHKRHLQTQADAAALAGGTAWAFPCTTTGTANVNQAIIDAARAYAGPSTTSGPSAQSTGPYNPQVGATPSSKLHVLLNSTSYYNSSATADQNFTDGQPCAKGYLDVKMTESNPLRFFDLGGIVGSLNVRARVKALQAKADTGFLPIGVELPKIYKAQATISSTTCGPITTPAEIKLAPLPAGQQTDPTMTLWGPDPAVYPSGTVPVAAPSFGSCITSGTDYEGIEVNVQVSGFPTITPTTSNCANQFVDCFDTVRLRAFKALNGSSTTPKFGNVQLTGGTCSPGSPYWASGNVTDLPCAFNATADVNWGTVLGSVSGFTGTLSAKLGGGTSTVANVTANGTYAFSGFSSGDGVPSSGTTAPQNMSIDWSWEATGGSWSGKACTKKKPCSDSGTTVVHQANAASSSPVLKVSVTNPTNGLPLDSFDQSGFPGSVALVVGIQDTSFQLRQKVVLRNLSSQGSGALNCDPNAYPNGKTLLEFKSGCAPFYAENPLTTGTWEPCPNVQQFPANSGASPWLCVPTEPGNQGGKIVPDGIDVATKNCNGLNGGKNQCTQPVCNNRNLYDASNPNQTFDPTTDPRVIKIFLVPYGSLKSVGGSGQNGALEVVGSAEFYVTGWNGSPCKTLGDEALPANADAIGHFVKVAELSNPIPDPNKDCDPTSLTPCVVVLVR